MLSPPSFWDFALNIDTDTTFDDPVRHPLHLADVEVTGNRQLQIAYQRYFEPCGASQVEKVDSGAVTICACLLGFFAVTMAPLLVGILDTCFWSFFAPFFFA